jgi:hypothetical protein
MQAPDPIEAALARLMPTAMSVSGQREIEDMLDELAAELPATPNRRWKYPIMGLGAAAAIAALVAVPSLLNRSTPGLPFPQIAQAETVQPDMQWLEESQRVESMADEGWVSTGEGIAMQAVRVRMIGENTLRDQETGYTVHISEPRSELLLMPVSSF